MATYTPPHIKAKNRGALHRQLGVKRGKKLTIAQLHKAANSKSPKLRKRAQFAINARKWKH